MLKIAVKLKARLTQGGSAKNVATLTLGTVIAQGIAIAVTPVLSRLYTPAEFGVVAVFMAVATVVATFVTLRYEVSILVPKSDNEAQKLVVLSLSLAVCLGSVVSVISWGLPDSLKDILGVGLLGHWLPWACLSGVATAMITTASGWLNRSQLYMKMAKLRVLQSVMFAGLSMALGLWNFNEGLLFAQMGSVFLVMLLVVRYLPMPNRVDIADIPSIADKFNNMPKFMLPAALLDTITLQMPVMLIGVLFGDVLAGQFSMAWRTLLLPMGLVGGAVGQVFFQQFSEVVDVPSSALRLIKKTWLVLGVISFMPLLVVFLFGESLFCWVFGDSWAEAGKIASALAPMMLTMSISSPTSAAYVVLGLQKYSFIFGLVTFLYRPLCIYIGFLFDNLVFGVFCWVMIEVVVIYIYQYVTWRELKLRELKHL